MWLLVSPESDRHAIQLKQDDVSDMELDPLTEGNGFWKMTAISCRTCYLQASTSCLRATYLLPMSRTSGVGGWTVDDDGDDEDRI